MIISAASKLETDDQRLFSLLCKRNLIRACNVNNQIQFEIYHDKIRENIIKNLPRELKKSRNLQLALTLEEKKAATPEQLIVHFQAAEANYRASKYVVIAANQAEAVLAFDLAAKLYQTALELREKSTLTGNDPHSVNAIHPYTLYIKLAESLIAAGRGVEAAEVFLKAEKYADINERLECW